MPTPDAQNPAPLAVALHGGEEEFPVLKAFENYLEAERQKSRRRIIGLTCVFSGILLMVIVLFIVIGALLINKMFSQQDRLFDHMIAQQRPQQVQAPAAPPPTPAPQPQPVAVEKTAPAAERITAAEPQPEPVIEKPVPVVAAMPAAPVKPKPVIEIPMPPPKPEIPRIPPPQTPEGVVAPPPPNGLKVEGRYIKTPNSPAVSWQIWTR